MTTKTDLKNFTLPQLTDFVHDLGLKPFRARQIFSWLYRPGIKSFSQMTDLSIKVRDLLDQQAYFSRLTPHVMEKSKDGTIKYGFFLENGAMIESVLIPEQGRNTLCVSSQVGCAMGCGFCLTGTMGFTRNLSPAEIVNQVYAVMEDTGFAGENRVHNLVFMGMGEPLANFDNLIVALNILLDQRGLNFSERRITVSTCGIVPKIRELGEKVKVNLAISLHTVEDHVRDQLMPINKRYPVDALLAALKEFPLPKRRRIMIEYILLDGINDSPDDARMLAGKLRGIRCKINLLPFNESSPLPYKSPPQERVAGFQQILWKAGFTVIIRESRGADISAACGQLASTIKK